MIDRYKCKEIERIFSEENKWKIRLEVEATIAEVQYELGIIPVNIGEKLRKIPVNVERIKEIEKITNHDINAFVFYLVDNMGDGGNYVHYGLTSYDIVDTANAMILKEAMEYIGSELNSLIPILEELAIKHKYTKMMGRTHGVHAEPITFGVKVLGFLSELRRNISRLKIAMEEISYAKISGAVGTYTMIPPEVEERVLKKLGLNVEPVSTQVVPRDRYAFMMATLNLIGVMFERMAMQVRLLQRTETDELREPFKSGQTGSSAMPHKKNPVRCERITGLVRILRGYLIPSFENVILWDERDISHSSVERIILPDAFHILCFIIHESKDIFKNVEVQKDNMLRNISDEKIFSQRLLLKLIDKGVRRDRAYRMVQRNALRGEFLKRVKEDKDIMSLLSEEELEEIFKLDNFYENIDKIYERMGLK